MKQEGPVLEAMFAVALAITAAIVTGKPSPKPAAPLPGFVVPPAPVPPPAPIALPKTRAEPCRTLFCPEDYPAEAVRLGQEGIVAVEVEADETGKPTRCTLKKSSGHKLLDAATCPILMRREHYDPAKGKAGKPLKLRIRQSVEWRLQSGAGPASSAGAR